MTAVLVTLAGTLRRLLNPASVALVVLSGVLTGLAVLSLPSSSLAIDVFPGLLRVLSAIVVLPLAAGIPTADRSGGYEQLQALRPHAAWAWTTGRMLGSVLGVATLVLLMAATARWVGGSRPVPAQLQGQRMDRSGTSPQWRFPLPAGARGPFELSVPTIALPIGGGTLAVEVSRGSGALALAPLRVLRQRAGLTLPDLWPERGDLFVTLRPSEGLLLSETSPLLTVGEQPLAREGLPLPLDAAGSLLLALLAALAAACAFHFETACLAGILALAVELPAGRWAWPVAIAALLIFGTLGTALVRRQALP